MPNTTKILQKNKIFPLEIVITVLTIIIIGVSFLLDTVAQQYAEQIQNTNFSFFLSIIASYWMIFIILLLIPTILLWKEKRDKWIFPIWLAIISSAVIAFIAKLIVQRTRPLGMEYLFNIIPDYAFPSLHTAAAFASLFILAKAYPKYKYLFISYAVIVGLSRIYLKAHYFSDVVAGAALGCGVGYLFLWFVKYNTKPWILK